MTPFRSHRGVLAPLDRANVDTDAIIPKQFLKSIARTGFGPQLFFDWRYLPDGKPNPDFILNRSPFNKASVLVARNNFGCGSSREHAVWAIHQAGFHAIIAPWQAREGSRVPGFADIFRNNSFKNAVLTVELSSAEVDKIFQMVDRFPGLEATVNLEEQRVTLHLPEEISFHFEIDKAVRESMLQGLDDIGTTLKHQAEITAFEKTRPGFLS